jgi:hypothetical protein
VGMYSPVNITRMATSTSSGIPTMASNGNNKVPGGACCKPSDQPRDAARWEEYSGLDENSLTTICRCDGRAKGIAREHQNGFL